MNTVASSESNRWARSLDLLIDGSLSAEEANELLERLKTDEQLLGLYLEKMRMESLLRDHAWQAGETKSAAPRPVVWRGFHKRQLAWAAAAAVALVFALGGLWQMQTSGTGGAVATQGLPDVQFSAASVFETASPAISEDGRLQFGDGVVMSDGTVSIRLPSGVEAVLKSPSRFAITGPNRFKLDQGTGWFRVPAKAKGFAVDLPGMEVVDLGTVFTVQADETLQQVQVEQGTVEVRQRTGDQPVRRLLAGEMLMRRANASVVEVVSGTALYKPDSAGDKQEVLFEEILAHVPNQSFLERKPLIGSWQVLAGEAHIMNGKFVGRQKPFTHLMGRFSRAVEPRENAVILLTFRSVSPMTLFHSEGYAGISLFDGDGEMFFFGDKARDSYSWNVVTYGKMFRREGVQENRKFYDLAIQGSQETFTLRYRQRDGRFDVFRGDGVNGLPIVIGKTDAGLRFDGVRVATGRGGDFSFDRLRVSVIKDSGN
ncbi:FecR domain-containing protein [Prosthecobacter sp.]|uniref:FecR domain-containing protein n=1 Tax=Prosthecobacter sp. TaxID=1965333 RepID=UPI003782FB64